MTKRKHEIAANNKLKDPSSLYLFEHKNKKLKITAIRKTKQIII